MHARVANRDCPRSIRKAQMMVGKTDNTVLRDLFTTKRKNLQGARYFLAPPPLSAPLLSVLQGSIYQSYLKTSTRKISLVLCHLGGSRDCLSFCESFEADCL